MSDQSSADERLVGRFLYHITDVDNVSSIAEAGLQSHNRAHGQYRPTDISDPEVQGRRQGSCDPHYGRQLHDYVCLYFRAKGPMLYRRQDRQCRLAVLYVASSVLEMSRVVFTDGNAASPRTKFYYSAEDLQKLDWNCLRAQYWTDFPDGKRKRCAEVLVPDEVPVQLIDRVVVYDDWARTRIGPTLWSVEVRPEYCFKDDSYSQS